MPLQRLVLKTLLYSRLSKVGNQLLEELLQYCTKNQNAIELAQVQFCTKDQNAIEPVQRLPQFCTKDQNAIKLAQGTVPDCPLEDPDQLSSPFARIDGRTPLDSAMDISEYVQFPSDVLWAGDCKYRLNTTAIKARNSIILNSKKECYLS